MGDIFRGLSAGTKQRFNFKTDFKINKNKQKFVRSGKIFFILEGIFSHTILVKEIGP